MDEEIVPLITCLLALARSILLKTEKVVPVLVKYAGELLAVVVKFPVVGFLV